MRKRRKHLLAALLAAGLCAGLIGCRGRDAGQKESLVYLDYGTGLTEDGDYNSALYGMNTNEIIGWDPGCFYVSEEEDPVYGGWFYMYPTSRTQKSATTLNSEYYIENKVTWVANLCYRSRDLYRWEMCGVLDGYTLQVDEEDWCQDEFWAPEVIRNPADGKYYMYFSAAAQANYGVEGISASSNVYDRLHLGVAVSDSPVGPFDVLYDTDAATGKRIPTINFHTGCGSEFPWAAIDVSPFFDDDGELYLYFNKHQDDHYSSLNGIWGMRMKTMSQPDYTTVTCLTQAGKTTASNTPGNITEVSVGADYFSTESGINEAPFMYKYNGTYYLTYSSNGLAHISYSVHQAIGSSPLGEFRKLDADEGNPVLDGSLFGVVNGTAHHSFVRVGDELWMLYHRHDSNNGYSSGWGRSIGSDRVCLTENADGLMVLTANGPSKCLVWLPEEISGYQNLAESATVKISAGDGVEYLNDGLLPYYTVSEEKLMSVEGTDVTVTLKWEEPVSVSSLMVYNAREMNTAFSEIADIRFRLAERPGWASRDYDYAVIKDLTFPEQYYDLESEDFISCAPAVAEFDPILVSEIAITVKATDRLVEFNKFGEENTLLNLCEIVVLGGVDEQ